MTNTETTFNTEFFDSKIENQPYLDPLTREVLEAWMEANDDSIEVIFQERDEWEKKKEFLEKPDEQSTNKHTILSLPTDLNLLEIPDVVDTLYKHVFRNNPELSTQGIKKFGKLAETFKKVGVYINENIGNMKEGKDIAEDLSKKFFNHGLSLESKITTKDQPVQPTVLSESDKRELDKWLIGKERYYKVMSRLGSNPSQEDINRERQRHFEGYFKALSRKGFQREWNEFSDPIAEIQKKTKRGIENTLSFDSDIYRAIFESGKKSMKEKIKRPRTIKLFLEMLHDVEGKELMIKHQKLYDYLEIPRLKEELTEVRSTGDIEKISKKEFEIATKIREEINTYEYEDFAMIPSEVVKDNYLQCLTSTLFGTSLLDELGIKYLYVAPPNHSMTFLLTSNGKLYWQDFTPEQFSKNGKEVTSDMFEENPNILALAENSDFFNIIEKQSQKKFSISNSADVMMSHLISNLGGILKGEKAIQLNKKSIEINPNDPELYNNLASSYDSLKRYEDALEAIKEGIKVDRNYVHFYENLAKVFRKLGRDEDVVKALEEGQKRDPNNSYWSKSLAPAYEKLGRYEDARTARIDAFIIDTFINESTD